MNIPFIGYQDIYEKPNQKSIITPSPGTNGLRWISLLEDFIVVMKSNNGLATRIKMFMSSLHGKRVYAVFSLNDPLPSIVHLLVVIKNFF